MGLLTGYTNGYFLTCVCAPIVVGGFSKMYNKLMHGVSREEMEERLDERFKVVDVHLEASEKRIEMIETALIRIEQKVDQLLLRGK
jgi:hypothetical protein